MKFKEITADDAAVFEKFKTAGENSCENTFITQLMWNNLYRNSFAVGDGTLYIRSEFKTGEVYSLPFGDLENGVRRINAENGVPVRFWAQEGARFERFCAAFSDEYIFSERPDAADYIYLRDELADLPGKKFHGKRNHISAFSKKYDWRYEPITAENLESIRSCAELWYQENEEKDSVYLSAEHTGLRLLLDGLVHLPVKGGAIFCGETAVAFTIGSEINSLTYDIHIEKALREYQEAYSVINREFTKNELEGYKWINREDDMGLDGLRQAKLSYHPVKRLKKYDCIPR